MPGTQNVKRRGIISSAWNYVKNSSDYQRGGMAGYIGNAVVVVGGFLMHDMAAVGAGTAAFGSDAFFLANRNQTAGFYSLGQLTGALAVEMYRQSGAAANNPALRCFMAAQVIALSVGALRAPLEWAAQKISRFDRSNGALSSVVAKKICLPLDHLADRTQFSSPRLSRALRGMANHWYTRSYAAVEMTKRPFSSRSQFLQRTADNIPPAISFVMPGIRVGNLITALLADKLSLTMALSQSIYSVADIYRGGPQNSFIKAREMFDRSEKAVRYKIVELSVVTGPRFRQKILQRLKKPARAANDAHSRKTQSRTRDVA